MPEPCAISGNVHFPETGPLPVPPPAKQLFRRFTIHYTSDVMPPVSIVWEGVQFSTGAIAVGLGSGKMLQFPSLLALQDRFLGCVITWLDSEE